MAFFDDLKRNASDVASKAAKKTNELTGIAKLQVAIKSNESKLSSVYEEIGRLFYNAERSGLDCTSDIANCIMKADKLKAEIAAAKAEAAKLRKVTVCEGCGNEISDSAAFCPHCGLKQIKPEPEAEEAEETEEACCCEDAAEDCCCSCEESAEEEAPCCCDCEEEKNDAE